MNTQSKLAYFPVALFASVMGIGGLSLAFKKASGFYLDSTMSTLFGHMSLFFGILASTIFVILFLAYIVRLFLYYDYFKIDLNHQVKINFLSSIPISMLILITFFSVYSYLSILEFLFYIASILQLLTSIYVISFWFKNSMKNHLLSPAWFIPIVGNLIVPLAANSIGVSKDIMLFFFSIGCFFWVILTSLVLHRLIFEVSLEQKFLPTLFIFIAPPSVFVVDFYVIFVMHNELSMMIYFIAVFFVLLLASISRIFINIKFTLSWWAFTFPMCAFSIAGGDLYMFYKVSYLKYFSLIGLIVSLFLVIFVFIKTIFAIKNGRVFIAE